MSPGLRLVLAPALLLLGALACYGLPPRAASAARAVGVVALGASSALVGSLVGVVGGGSVERSLGDLVPGVPLELRADAAGTVLALLAQAAALASLVRRRLPLQRSGLLLVTGGTLLCTLGGNLVLLAAGLQLVAAGALLCGTATRSPRPRLVGVLGVHYLGTLGLLAAAILVLTSAGTVDLVALPQAAIGPGVALGWLAAGAACLLAPVALPGEPSPEETVWVAVSAVPAGLGVLLRLHGAAAASGVPGGVGAFAMGAGSLGAVVAAAGAWHAAERPGVVGRRLCLAAAAVVVALVGAGTDAALGGAALLGIGLVAALVASPVWTGAEDRPPRWSTVAGLGLAGGLPWGPGAAGLVVGLGAVAATGRPRGLLVLPLSVAACLVVAATARAASLVLGGSPAGRLRSLPRDAAVGLGVGAVLGLLPGLTVAGISGHVAGAAALQAVGVAAVSGPGGGWPGGYLLLGALVVAVAAVSAAVLGGWPQWRWEPAVPLRAPRSPVLPVPMGWAVRLIGSLDLTLERVDGWLAGQPSLATAVVVAAACILVAR